MPGAQHQASARGGEYPARGGVVITRSSGLRLHRSPVHRRWERPPVLTFARNRRLFSHGCPVLGVGPHRRRDPGDARRRPRRPCPHPARPVAAGGGDLVGGVRRHRRRLRAARAVVRRARVRRGILRRLRHREEPLGRQPVRLRADHGQLRRPAGAAAEGAAVRHHVRPRPAHRLHPGRRGGDRELQLGLLRLRRVPRLDGGRPGALRLAAGARVPGERRPAADPQGPADDGGVPLRQADHPARRQALHHAAGRRAHRDRQRRRPVRRRLHPGDLRPHPGDLPRLRGQRVLAARPAAAVLPARRPARPAGLPLLRAGRDPGLHRREAAGPRAAHQRRSSTAGST
jgi:hypothetical protein